MTRITISRRALMASTGAASLVAIGGKAFAAKPSPPPAEIRDYMFTEGGAEQLAGIKRVIISNFVVAFQLDGSMRKDNATKIGGLTLFGGNSKEVVAKMVWQNPDVAMMQGVADAGLAKLKAEFKARGLEVLDEALLASQPAYNSIIAATGLKNLEDYPVVNQTEAQYRKSHIGPDVSFDAKIVSASGLVPYNHSVFEGGQCCWVSKGFPSSKVYYVPGFEIDLAKALDCVVVKAWQFVYFSQLEAGVNQDGWAGGAGGATVQYSAAASSQVRIAEHKTRLSFRLPTSTDKTKNVAKSWDSKDGDVVVTLGRPMFVGDRYYVISEGGAKGWDAFHSKVSSSKHIFFSANMSDPSGYKADLTKGMGSTMAGMLTAALGR